jgi:hypothetical protein
MNAYLRLCRMRGWLGSLFSGLFGGGVRDADDLANMSGKRPAMTGRVGCVVQVEPSVLPSTSKEVSNVRPDRVAHSQGSDGSRVRLVITG